MTAQTVYGLAISIMSRRESDGTIDEDRTALYEANAPSILTLFQSENAYDKTYEFSQEYINPIISGLGIIDTSLITSPKQLVLIHFKTKGTGTI